MGSQGSNLSCKTTIIGILLPSSSQQIEVRESLDPIKTNESKQKHDSLIKEKIKKKLHDRQLPQTKRHKQYKRSHDSLAIQKVFRMAKNIVNNRDPTSLL